MIGNNEGKNEQETNQVLNSNQTGQIQDSTNQISNQSQVSEQTNIENIENQKLSSQLSLENQNIVSQQEVIQKQLNEKKMLEEEEKRKKQEELLNNDDNKGPTTFAKVMTIFLFIGLFAFVYFLGDITDYINLRKLEKEAMEMTNGKLICENNRTSDNLDIKINATFTFENKGITSLNYVITSTGDKQKDKAELEKLNSDCKTLRQEVLNYSGINIVCTLNNGVNTVKQTFNYATINNDEINSAYSEAGGVYPQFKYKDDINSVQSKMISSDYSCEKVSR